MRRGPVLSAILRDEGAVSDRLDVSLTPVVSVKHIQDLVVCRLCVQHEISRLKTHVGLGYQDVRVVHVHHVRNEFRERAIRVGCRSWGSL